MFDSRLKTMIFVKYKLITIRSSQTCNQSRLSCIHRFTGVQMATDHVLNVAITIWKTILFHR
jgi:hypothetical protein